MEHQVLVLLSGGIDSAACAHLASKSSGARCLFVNYGQLGMEWEHVAADRIGNLLSLPLSVVTLSSPTKFGPGEISGRNAFLVVTALMFGGIRAGEIVIGIHSGTPYYDCTPAFLTSVNRIIGEYSDGKIRVVAPFLGNHKRDILQYLESTPIPVEATYSCESGTEAPCGRCMSCRDRKALGC